MDVVLVGAITHQYRFLFVLPLDWVAVLRHPMLLCILPSFPSLSLNVNVLTTLQTSQSNPPYRLVPTSYLEQLWITPHGASPTVSFPTRLTWSAKPSAFQQA
ncbi:hypothetical protein K443DRAFT_575819 [Laccaria amethystina LaAM-08-1]|uniref:Uncharacterized protein n=1 Tax=Laccaria amethystina LaAM-08-1 TaxID=1095629 RepID=A0A0C9XU49_9AGAR|nr:hypothetical protein K443DRAFT_575819 [Laccaria amethystina LaAM-08-1]